VSDVFGNHIAEITGGTVDVISGYDNSRINISGVATIGAQIIGYGGSVITIDGAGINLASASLDGYGDSRFVVTGGSIGTVYANERSRFEISGGDFGDVYVSGESDLALTGGRYPAHS
jgi:hypothetical protein